jgi:hypothetical protein
MVCELTAQVYGSVATVSSLFCFPDIGTNRHIYQAFAGIGPGIVP